MACVLVAAYAKTRPAAHTVTHKVPYTQQGHVTYHAIAPTGPVYPNGTLGTGDPIFLQLVHRVDIRASYRFAVDAPKRLRGTQQVFLQLNGPTGWTRRIALSPIRHFTGTAITTPATIDLRAVSALLDQVQKATGIPSVGASVGIVMKVHVTGTVAGQPVDESFTPTAGFQLQPLELTPSGSAPPAAAGTGSSSASSTETGFDPSAPGSVTSVSSVPSTISIAGHNLSYSAIARLAVGGFLLFGALSALLAVLLKRNQAFDEATRIRARYSHLLVPILIGEDLGWPPVDVTNFKALVRLAEAAGQVILHHQADAVDTYLVNDNGTVYRYQISLPVVSWGEWTDTNVAADPAALAEAATALADVAGMPTNAAALADATGPAPASA